HLNPHPLLLFLPTPPTTAPCTLSLHDALPISGPGLADVVLLLAGVILLVLGLVAGASVLIVIGIVVTLLGAVLPARWLWRRWSGDRKSTRLNSSHVAISYAVFCLKKKKRHDRK